MNSPSTGRTPDRAPLRVYLAGDADPSWRLALLNASVHEPYAIAVQTGECDAVFPGALPYGHTFIGPYAVRQQLDFFDLQATDLRTVERGKHLKNLERYRMRQISRSDIIFSWLPSSTGACDVGTELGLAYAAGKAVVLAAPARTVLDSFPVATELAWKMVVAADVKNAYEHIMADLDVTFERGMARIESKYGGQCTVCRSSYKEGDTIYWSKPRGGMHLDCHELVFSQEELSSVTFNSELVRALRHENAALEEQLLDLQTKLSMAEKQVAEDKQAYDELYADYQKWVHP